MKKKELYEKYKKEEWIRKVWKRTFYIYLDEYKWYDKVISFLNKSKKTTNNKTGTLKRKNTKEILDFVKLFSIEKAAKEYDVSERTIYRYINKK